MRWARNKLTEDSLLGGCIAQDEVSVDVVEHSINPTADMDWSSRVIVYTIAATTAVNEIMTYHVLDMNVRTGDRTQECHDAAPR